jgi:cellulose synthase/poly-beta-1,6-N-acetylglucosamine synthase-like glycosyltransferase
MSALPSPRVVSVVVPACNAASVLPACLDALHKQALPPGVRLEIVVVDDNSHDTTSEIARQAGAVCVPAGSPDDAGGSANLPNWLIWRPANSRRSAGPGQARNRGVAASSGDPILFTDADCEPTPEWAAHLLRALADPQVAGAKGRYQTRQTNLVARFVQLEYSHKSAGMARREWIDFVDTYSAAYRRAVFIENGGFEAGLMGDEDQEFSFRLAKRNYRLKYVPEAVVFHQHLTSFRRYFKRKFTIAFWKMQLLRWHPEKALGDSHTPASQRLQIVLAGPLLLSAAAALLWQPAAWAAAALSALFLAATLPFLAWVARHDWPVLPISLPMLVSRAVAQALGLAVGAVAGVVRRPARQATQPPLDLLTLTQLPVQTGNQPQQQPEENASLSPQSHGINQTE